MELHPILEKNSVPKSGLWYVLSALGECPSVRVGHTCTHITGESGSNGKIYVIGGANPNGSFGDTFILDLDVLKWDISSAPGFKPRYEHTAFVPASTPTKIYIFGGADQGKNLNDIQVYDTAENTWSSVSASGSPPSPRTYHTCASSGDKLYVYSGGLSGSDPVGDRQLHYFDAKTESWSIINARGDSPKPRHGHVVAVVGKKLLVHGGMAGSTFYDDLNVFDLDKLIWKTIKQKKNYPCARTAHGSLVHENVLYIFGGMGRVGALDDTYKLDTDSMKWYSVDIQGPPPACRLDFGMCSIKMNFIPDIDANEQENLVDETSAEEVAASGRMAKEVLEQQLRMGSAGSGKSLGSAGDSRLGSAGSITSSPSRNGSGGSGHSGTTTAASTHIHSNQRFPEISTTSTSPAAGEPVETTNEGAAAIPQKDVVADSSTVLDLCLIFGGMDTEGEIFEDTLVLPIF